MQSFLPLSAHTGILAPIGGDNIDTDQIVPRQFLKTANLDALKTAFLNEWRYDDTGAPRQDFILNRAPYSEASMLLTDSNFGCGSSREHAAWALVAAGIRVVAGISFNSAFVVNAANNGIACVTLCAESHLLFRTLAKHPETASAQFDLEKQTLTMANAKARFSIDAFQRSCLLGGQSATDVLIAEADDVGGFETRRKQQFPWLSIGHQ